MKTTDKTFDPKTDGRRPRIIGTLPGHICKFETRAFGNTRKVFNLTIRFAPEALDVAVKKVEFDETGKMAIDDDNFKDHGFNGVEIRASGLWLDTSPDTEGWKNGDYLEACEALGVEMPVDKDTGEVTLGEIEEEDVIGLPCLAQLGFETKKDDPSKVYQKVTAFFPWENGKRIEIEPF